eukprot:GILK01006598.1.p1 GENE.GILK01006598.1~~GILK01006598.1.p1  ORF type:complete len:1078 (-),score=157.86 GILK01006598.1:278-3511(-)
MVTTCRLEPDANGSFFGFAELLNMNPSINNKIASSPPSLQQVRRRKKLKQGSEPTERRVATEQTKDDANSSARLRQWFLSLSPRDRSSLLTVEDSKLVLQLRSMYAKRSSHSDGLFASLHPSDYYDRSGSFRSFRDENLFLRRLSFPESNYSDSFFFADKTLIESVRLCDTHDYLDTFTVSRSAVEEGEEFLKNLDVLSRGGFLSVPCRVSFDAASKQWIWDTPAWFSLNPSSLGVWIACQLEKTLWMRFWHHFDLDPRRKGETLKYIVPLAATRHALSKDHLIEYWQTLSEEERRAVVGELSEAVPGSGQNKKGVGKKKKSSKMSNDMRDSRSSELSPLLGDGLGLSSVLCPPFTFFLTTNSSPDKELMDMAIRHDENKFFEFLFMSPLDRAASCMDKTARQLGAKIQNAYTEKIALDLLLAEDKAKDYGTKKGKKKKATKKKPVVAVVTPTCCHVEESTVQPPVAPCAAAATVAGDAEEAVRVTAAEANHMALSIVQQVVAAAEIAMEEKKRKKKRSKNKRKLPLSVHAPCMEETASILAAPELNKAQESESSAGLAAPASPCFKPLQAEQVVPVVSKAFDVGVDGHGRICEGSSTAAETNSDHSHDTDSPSWEDLKVAMDDLNGEAEGEVSSLDHHEQQEQQHQASYKHNPPTVSINSPLSSSPVSSSLSGFASPFSATPLASPLASPVTGEALRESSGPEVPVFDHRLGSDEAYEGENEQEEERPLVLSPEDLAYVLHADLMDNLTENLVQVEQARFAKMNMIGWIQEVVSSLYPGAQVEVYGSLATGLSLPTSDVDLVVTGIRYPDRAMIIQLLRFLATELEKFVWVRSLQAIDTALVPVIKLVADPMAPYLDEQGRVVGIPPPYANLPIAIDITFDESLCISPRIRTHFGLASCALLKEYTFTLSAFQPLVVFIKQLLVDRKLNNAYTGGLSSYCIGLMVAAFLNSRPAAAQDNLGQLLLDFLHFYGRTFNCSTTGVSVANGGSFFALPSVPVAPLVIEDPLNPGYNAAKNAYAISSVRDTFAEVHRFFMSFCNYNGSSSVAVFDTRHPSDNRVSLLHRVLFQQPLPTPPS